MPSKPRKKAVEAPPVVAAPEPPPIVEEAMRQVYEKDADQHIILQLPISSSRVDDILQGATTSYTNLPTPYVAHHEWTMSCTETASTTNVVANACSNCFWCCHPIPSQKFGMPIDYDAAHRMFTVYGHFCSLQCVAAHNMSTHMGSDRMWDVHGWIQMMAKVHGMPLPVRPAPSRFVLKMFGGPMDIDDFRAIHRTCSRTVVLNVPPLVNVQPQVEVVNTSFLNTRKEPDSEAKGTHNKLIRKKSIVDQRKTLESKMNLSYTLTAAS